MTQARNLSRLLNKDITTYMYTATAGQTVFTGSDTNSQTLTIDNQSIMVTYNGVMLEKGSEFTVALNTVTLLAGAEVNAEVNVIVFNNASLGGYVKSTGGDINGGVNITSGNLLVGTTDTNVANNSGSGNDGVSIQPDSVRIARTDGDMILLNRLNSDGDIAKFLKDGSTVGTIGSRNSDLTIGNVSTGLQFFDNLNMIAPMRPDTNALRDNAIDLGIAGARFKDLFLGGGVHLGGTGAANKFDDYEEGTFTPGILNGWGILNPTYSTNAGFYTKVGNIVHVAFRITLSGGSTNANGLKLTGLPFTVGATTNVGTNLSGWFAAASSNATNIFLGLEANETQQSFYYQNSNGTSNFLGTDAGTGFSMTFSGTYQTA